MTAKWQNQELLTLNPLHSMFIYKTKNMKNIEIRCKVTIVSSSQR